MSKLIVKIVLISTSLNNIPMIFIGINLPRPRAATENILIIKPVTDEQVFYDKVSNDKVLFNRYNHGKNSVDKHLAVNQSILLHVHVHISPAPRYNAM